MEAVVLAIKAIRGMKDLLPPEDIKWQKMEETARRVVRSFGFSEIRTPILEKTELFVRSIGESTDVVEKEMYTFPDRSGDSLSMRPEATAAVIALLCGTQTVRPARAPTSSSP